MKKEPPGLSSCWLSLVVVMLFAVQTTIKAQVDSKIVANNSAPIPMDQLGAVAGRQYQGDGLSVTATPDGARLRCAFQRLEGEVTSKGLWLSSTAENPSNERFRIRAVEVGRVTPCAPFEDWLHPTEMFPGLSCVGVVAVADNLARFVRPSLTEEYSVSVDGVRQDFIVEQRPEGEGELRVELDVTGAKAEPLVNGARLALGNSGRKLAYNRLRVVDARGQELMARLEVTEETRLAVLVHDAAAIYPVRIDPTFSDADWISMGGVAGANGRVRAAAVDGSGNLYVGGAFTIVGDIFATNMAKWNGSAWSALGVGVNSEVLALAVSGSDVYAGGAFTTAGGSTANYIAKWTGSSWSAVGSGMDGPVIALMASASDVYVGGGFTRATNSGDVAVIVNGIAKWNGSSWSALGSGMNSSVGSLAMSGTSTPSVVS